MITKLQLPILHFSPYRLVHKYLNLCNGYNKKQNTRIIYMKIYKTDIKSQISLVQ